MRLALPYVGRSPEELTRVCTETCGAGCCRGPVTVSLAHGEADRLRGLATERGVPLHLVDDSGGGYFRHQDQPGQVCPFLDGETNRCGIYEDRPNACRNFPDQALIPRCYLSGWEPKPQVFVASVHGKAIPYEFHHMRDLIIRALADAGQYGGHTSASSVRVDHNRNICVESFLATKADYLLFIDDDMTFPPEVGVRLASYGKDIAAGLYFQRGRAANEVYPHWYRTIGESDDRWGQRGEMYRSLDQEVYQSVRNLPLEDCAMERRDVELVPLDAAGTGCVLIHRRVFEQVPGPWFHTTGPVNGDLMFFQKAGRAGFSVWGDPGVICGHYRYETISVGTFRRAMERRLGAAFGELAAAGKVGVENCNTPDYWDYVHGAEAATGWRRSYPETDAVYAHILGHFDEDRQPIVVDFGCGRSRTYERLREAMTYVRYVGLDHSMIAVDDNKRAYPGASWFKVDIRDEWVKPESADMCISSEVIEHLDDPEGLIQRMWDAVRPGGIVAIGFPVGDLEATPAGEHVQVFDLDRMTAMLERFSQPVQLYRGDGVRRVAVIEKPLAVAVAEPEREAVTA